MRLAVMSDLHNELERGKAPARPSEAWFELRRQRESIPGHPAVGPLLPPLQRQQIDLIALSGDIDVGLHGIEYADQVARFLEVPVVYVAGNHEAYHHSLDSLIAELSTAADRTDGRVRFLECGTASFDQSDGRVHVLGCTLWTDYRLNGNSDTDLASAMRDAAAVLEDHHVISFRGDRFLPEQAREVHAASRQWLTDEVARLRTLDGDEARIIIVSHHAPFPDANPPQYRGGNLCPAFASDLRSEIEAWRPSAWIWGHTHYSMTGRHGDTLLLSSQRGYVGVEDGALEYCPLVIEID